MLILRQACKYNQDFEREFPFLTAPGAASNLVQQPAARGPLSPIAEAGWAPLWRGDWQRERPTGQALDPGPTAESLFSALFIRIIPL